MKAPAERRDRDAISLPWHRHRTLHAGLACSFPPVLPIPQPVGAWKGPCTSVPVGNTRREFLAHSPAGREQAEPLGTGALCGATGRHWLGGGSPPLSRGEKEIIKETTYQA